MVSLLEVYRMADRFTLGVEEEFQLVKLDSGDLCSCVQSILDKGAPYFEEQARAWLPHLLALSSNSPFWQGRLTGIKSYRAVVWKRFPRSGMPDIFDSRHHFDRYVQDLVEMEAIDNGKKIWWDIRPHAFFD